MTPNIFAILRELKESITIMMRFAGSYHGNTEARLRLIEAHCRELIKEIEEAEEGLKAS